MDEYLEIIGIHSATSHRAYAKERYLQRPFRSPHHTISDVALLGGGSVPNLERSH